MIVNQLDVLTRVGLVLMWYWSSNIFSIEQLYCTKNSLLNWKSYFKVSICRWEMYIGLVVGIQIFQCPFWSHLSLLSLSFIRNDVPHCFNSQTWLVANNILKYIR